MKAVVIEDSKVMRHYIKTMLKQLNVEVIGEAEDGVAGLELVIQSSPDLVMLDLHLPKADGKDILKYLKQSSKNMKVVIMSALDAEEKEACYNRGADSILEKPFTLDQVKNVLESLK